jgi:hypothetical protein
MSNLYLAGLNYFNTYDSNNTFSGIGGPTSSQNISSFLESTAFDPVAGICSDGGFTPSSLSIDSSGDIWVVGNNPYGALSLGTSLGTNTWTKVALPGGVKARAPAINLNTLARSNYAYFVVGVDGSLYASGKSTLDQTGWNVFGTGSTFSYQNFTKISTSIPDPIEQVAVSSDATLVLTTTKDLYVTGANYIGQCTEPLSFRGTTTWTKIDLTNFDDTPIKSISGSSSGTFYALNDLNRLWSWGSDNFGLLGRESPINSPGNPYDYIPGFVVSSRTTITSITVNNISILDSTMLLVKDGEPYLLGIYDGFLSSYNVPTSLLSTTGTVSKIFAWGNNYALKYADGDYRIAGRTTYGQVNFGNTTGLFLPLTLLPGFSAATYFSGSTIDTMIVSPPVVLPSTTTTTSTTTTIKPNCDVGKICTDAIEITPFNKVLTRDYCPYVVGSTYGSNMYFSFTVPFTGSYNVKFSGGNNQLPNVTLYGNNICSSVSKTWKTISHVDTFTANTVNIFQVSLQSPSVEIVYSISYSTTTTPVPCPGANCPNVVTYDPLNKTETYTIPNLCSTPYNPFWLKFQVPFASSGYELYCAASTGNTFFYLYNDICDTDSALMNRNAIRTDSTFWSNPTEAKPTYLTTPNLNANGLVPKRTYYVHVIFSGSPQPFRFAIISPTTTSTTTTTSLPPGYWNVCDPCLTQGQNKCVKIAGGSVPCEYNNVIQGPFPTLSDCKANAKFMDCSLQGPNCYQPCCP